jgi:hypothetical protein
MAKYKYVLLGPEFGATSRTVIKELATYEGDSLKMDEGFVTVHDNDAQGFTVAVIRLAEGQSIKRKE